MLTNQTFFNVLLFLNLNPDHEFHSATLEAAKSSNLPYCNRVWVKDIPTPHDLTNVHTFMDSHPYTLWALADSPANAVIKSNAFFTYAITFPIMTLPLQSLKTYQVDSHITVKKVENKEDFDLWASLAAHIYNTNLQEFKNNAHYLASTAKERIAFYIAYWDQTPVATSAFLRENDVVGIHWVATLPEFRNKGIGFAATYLPLLHMQQNGISDAVLFTSIMGKPVYEKMGFKVVTDCHVYKSV